MPFVNQISACGVVDTIEANRVEHALNINIAGSTPLSYNGSTDVKLDLNTTSVSGATAINIVTSISASSTDNDIPSAKAVYKFVDTHGVCIINLSGQ